MSSSSFSSSSPSSVSSPSPFRPQAAAFVAAAGVVAALHVGKLAPAVTALQQALGLTLVQAGFLLSMVQLAGMSTGVAFGALADGLGPRRSMLVGLAVLSVASAAGAAAAGAPALMGLRALEGFGFLLVVLPAPALLRRVVRPERANLVLGAWGAYMPFATALALLGGPWLIGLVGWRGWWGLLALLTAAMGVALWAVLRPAAGVPVAAPGGPAAGPARPALGARLVTTLGAPGPWLVALAFAMYSGQWLAVIGFLPTMYTHAGLAGGTVALLTSGAAAVNMVGNITAGRLLHGGVRPVVLLAIGYTTMGLAAWSAFQGFGAAAPGPGRYLAVLVFSGVGGLIPGTLFTLAVRVAPGEGTVSATVGWVQQWSSFGQFCGPPLVAWVAARAGGWQWTWLATGACTLAGLAFSAAIAARLGQPPTSTGPAGR